MLKAEWRRVVGFSIGGAKEERKGKRGGRKETECKGEKRKGE